MLLIFVQRDNFKLPSGSLRIQPFGDNCVPSLLAGILLGVDTGIPQRVQEVFKTTGISHIIAISGFNIGIIAALFAAAFSRLLGRKWGAVAAILGIGLYTVLVGASFSILRTDPTGRSS